MQIEAKVKGPEFFEPRGKQKMAPSDWNWNPEWQKTHIVKVHEQTCTCGLYQDYLLPCCHALAALYQSKVNMHGPFQLIPSWFEPVSVLTAYDYLEHGQNEWGEDIIIHTGLRAVDIDRLDDDPPAAELLYEDPFKDLQVNPPIVGKRKGKKGKRRTAGDGKGPLNKPPRTQGCGVCGEPGHNRITCKRLVILEGTADGIGIE